MKFTIFHSGFTAFQKIALNQFGLHTKIECLGSTTLLKKCYDECISKIYMNNGSEGIILCDGWKNSSTNSKILVKMLHTVGGKRAFINAWDITIEAETDEKIAEILSESIRIAKEQYNVEFYAVVSDNASNMVKIGSLLKHVLWHSTCNGHTANLLGKDILDKKIVDKVSLVLKTFKYS